MVLNIIKKNFIEFYRNKISIILLFLFPLFFLFIFYMAFGSVDIGGLKTYNIAIINNDTGIPESISLPPELSSWSDGGIGKNLSNIILNTEYENSQPIFSNITVTNTNLKTALTEDTVELVMIIPENYSLLVLNQINNAYGNQSIPGYPTDVNATIQFLTAGNVNGEIATQIIMEIVETYHNSITEGVIPNLIEFQNKSVLQSEISSIFDYIASGILVFSTILAASYFSAMLLLDVEHETIYRIRMSSIEPWEYVLGFLIYSFILIMIQQVILIESAVLLFGFNPSGSLVRGYIILLLTSLPMYALIFTAGAFFESGDTAGNVIGFSSSILGFASGSFTEMPRIVIIRDIFWFRHGESDFILWDIVPWRHGVDAIRTVLLFDRTLSDVWGSLFLLVITSILWMSIAFYVYIKRAFRVED